MFCMSYLKPLKSLIHMDAFILLIKTIGVYPHVYISGVSSIERKEAIAFLFFSCSTFVSLSFFLVINYFIVFKMLATVYGQETCTHT